MSRWLQGLMLLVLLLAGCDKNDPAFILPGQTLQVSPVLESIHVGSTLKYVAIQVDENGEKSDVSDRVNWSSSDPATATIDAAGLASAVAVGTATISAELNGARSSAALEVHNKTVTGISVFPAQRDSIVGLTTRFSAMALFSDNTVQDVSGNAAWSSSDTAIASVDAVGEATATGVGDATLTASYAGFDGAAVLSVLAAAPTSFTVQPAAASIKAGTQQRYTATIGLSTGDFIDVTAAVTWATSDPSIAVASNEPGSEGVVLGVGDDTAAVLAVISNGSISLVADAEVTVREAAVTSLQVTPTDVSVPVGAYGNFSAMAGFDDGDYRDVTLESSWTSSDTDVGAIVSSGPNAGFALAVGTGNTAINASFGGVSASVNAAVTSPVLTRLEVRPGSASTIEGLTVPFTAYGLYSDLSIRDVTSIVNWSSDDTAVAVMDPKRPGLAQAVAPGSAAINAELDGVSDSSTLTVDSRTITALAVFPGESRSVVGLTTQYTATAVFNDSTIQEVTDQVNWSSDDNAVAFVDAQGLATATGAGDATITAVLSGVSGSAVLHVLGAVPVSFTVQPSTATLPAGTQRQYAATVGLSSGDLIDVTDNVIWLTGDADVATASNDPGSQGLVLGTGAGTTAVLASVPLDGVSLVATAALSVTEPAVTALQVTPQNIDVPVGARGTLQAVAYFDDNTSRDVTAESTWSSSDTAVAVVVPDGSSAGAALAIGTGSVAITASFEGVTDAAAIDVTGQLLVDLRIDPQIVSTPAGLSVTYSATGIYSDFSTQDVTRIANWSTDNAAVAVMDSANPGLAYAISPGVAQVSAEFGDLTDQADLTVTAATATDIVIRQRDASVYNGAVLDYQADITMSDGSVFTTDRTDALWSSSDTGVATFVLNRADSVGVGVATVTVTYTDPSGAGPPLTDSTSLAVTDAVITDLDVEPVKASISAGYEQAFKAIARYSDDSAREVTAQATWTSSNPTVATIDAVGVARGETVGTAEIRAGFAGLEESAALNVSTAVLERLIVVPEDITMASGEQRSFNAIAEYSDRIEEVTDSALWESSDAAVATVSNAPDSKGLVTGRSTLTAAATITARFDGLSDASAVTVTAPALVSIQVECGDDIRLDVGATGGCKAIGTYSDGDVSDITRTVDWSSSDASVLTAWRDSGSPEATIYGVAVGVADVTATEGIVSGSQTVTVTEVTLTAISVLSQNDTLLVNDTEQFFAVGTYSDSSTRTITREVTWSSSDDGVLQISNLPPPTEGLEPGKGLATAVGEGGATVSATLDAVTGSKAVTVLPNTPGIDEFVMFCNRGPIEGPSEIRVGQKARCEAHAAIDGVSENVTTSAGWSTDDPAIAEVDGIVGNSGKMDIVGVSAGTTFIRAEYEGFTAEIELIVR